MNYDIAQQKYAGYSAGQLWAQEFLIRFTRLQPSKRVYGLVRRTLSLLFGSLA